MGGGFFFRVVGTLEPAVRTGPAGASAVHGGHADGGHREPAGNGLGIAGTKAASSIMADACRIWRGLFLGTALGIVRRTCQFGNSGLW